jgi:hypothetical protein
LGAHWPAPKRVPLISRELNVFFSFSVYVLDDWGTIVWPTSSLCQLESEGKPTNRMINQMHDYLKTAAKRVSLVCILRDQSPFSCTFLTATEMLDTYIECLATAVALPVLKAKAHQQLQGSPYS